MKLGYCSWILFGKPLPDIFEFLYAEGCGCTSIIQGVLGLDRGEKAEAAAVIRQHRLTLCFHANLQGHANPAEGAFDEPFLSSLYDEIDWWREETGGLLYDCFSDSLSSPFLGGTDQQRIALTFELFRRHATHFAGTPVRYGIENTCGSTEPHNYDFYNCDRRFQEAFDAFGGLPGAGFLLDVGHAYVAAMRQGVDFGFYLDSIPFEICEVHVTDNHGKSDEHLRPGRGTLDFAALADVLRRRNFDGPVNMEVCKDLAKGQFGFNLAEPADADAVRAILADTRNLLGL